MAYALRRLSFAALILPAFTSLGNAEQSLLDRAKSLIKEDVAAPSIESLTDGDIASGLREALTIATDRVVGQLGAAGGYLDDPDLHIPLPEFLKRVRKTLKRVGLGGMTKDLEVRLNRAAELAAPRARSLFVDAVTSMTIEDARQILTGPEDAATQYLKRRMGPGLAEEIKPVIGDTLGEVGALALYDEMIVAYRDIPFVPDVKGDLTDYTVEWAMNGLFDTLAVEEAAIRANPAKRTTDLLKTVFGAG